MIEKKRRKKRKKREEWVFRIKIKTSGGEG